MEFFGINPGEALVLLVIAALVLGPRQIIAIIKRLQSLGAEISRFSAAARTHFKAETREPVNVLDNLENNIAITANQKNWNLPEIASPKAYIRAQVVEEMNEWINTFTTARDANMPTDNYICPHCHKNQIH